MKQSAICLLSPTQFLPPYWGTLQNLRRSLWPWSQVYKGTRCVNLNELENNFSLFINNLTFKRKIYLFFFIFNSHLIFLVLVYAFILLTVQREVSLNINWVTFWRENTYGGLCSPMASVTLIIGLGLKSCLHIVMPFAVVITV